MKDDRVYVGHIRDAMHQILEYVAGHTESSFLGNKMLQDAVIRQLAIIGEASKRVSETTRNQAVQLQWKEMAGMRDKLIHDYLGTDYFRVWAVAHERIPATLPHIERLLADLSPSTAQ